MWPVAVGPAAKRDVTVSRCEEAVHPMATREGKGERKGLSSQDGCLVMTGTAIPMSSATSQ